MDALSAGALGLDNQHQIRPHQSGRQVGEIHLRAPTQALPRLTGVVNQDIHLGGPVGRGGLPWLIQLLQRVSDNLVLAVYSSLPIA